MHEQRGALLTLAVRRALHVGRSNVVAVPRVHGAPAHAVHVRQDDKVQRRVVQVDPELEHAAALEVLESDCNGRDVGVQVAPVALREDT